MKLLINKNVSEGDIVMYLMEKHGYAFCMLTYYEVENHIMYLSNLNVSESQRRKYIGTEMIKYVIEYAKENGCEYLYLHVIDQNSWICEWYKRLGFILYRSSDSGEGDMFLKIK